MGCRRTKDRRTYPRGGAQLTDREPQNRKPQNQTGSDREENPARTGHETAAGEAATGAGLRWAIALLLAGALGVLLFGGPSPPG